MARLTRTQINQIKKIIADHMDVLELITVGDAKPSPALLKRLGLPKEITDLITNAYQYGRLGVLRGKDLSNMSTQEVRQLLRDLKLTKAQQYSIEASKARAQMAIDNITQRITSTVITMAAQSDLSMWNTIKEVIPDAVENNTPRYQVIQQLREKTGDLNRDWHRVAHTELWNAKLQGEAEAILNNESPFSNAGAETYVYKKPSYNACNKCKQLYLEADGVTPRVFKLSELLANGDNYGKKQADWKPTMGCVHPNCMCTFNIKPPGTKFDGHGNLVPDL